VQAYSSRLNDIANASVATDRFLIANGSTWVSNTLEATRTLLDIPDITGTLLYAEGDETLTGGFDCTPAEITLSGSVTPAFADGQIQYGTNNGAFTLLAPAGSGPLVLVVTNGATA